jgi:hypothetical protein
LQFASAASRKTHGGAGAFDIALPLSGTPGVECRNSGGNHSFVFTFSNNVISGNAIIEGGIGNISGAPVFSGNTMTVNVTGASDVQTFSVMLSGVTDEFSQVLPDAYLSVRLLTGDTNADGFVNAGDALQTRNRSGQATDVSNFRSDVNTDGAVNSGDTLVVRSRSGDFLP